LSFVLVLASVSIAGCRLRGGRVQPRMAEKPCWRRVYVQ